MASLVIETEPRPDAPGFCFVGCLHVAAHSVALNPFCQGLLIEGEADTNAAAR
jgi:hypothetical protein